MDREIVAIIKLKLFGGYATPAPPVGPALGQHGVNIGQFCREFNDQSQDLCGADVSVVVTVFDNKSFRFIIKKPTTTYLLKEAVKIRRGSACPNRETAGFITQEQLEKVAETKLPDLNTKSLDAAIKTIAGTARSMGIEIRQ